MIPKVIHYCWFGHGKMSPLMKKCLKSWKKYCPDYQIIEWNEDNFDINSTIWTKQAYEVKKWAFVADYVRLKVLYEYGGIYMDTDIELKKPLDRFLQHRGFSGFETPKQIQTGIIGAVPRHKMVKEWMGHYDNKQYVIDGQMNWEPNVKFMTEKLECYGLKLNDTYQEINDIAIYPQTFFCPLSIVSIENCISKDTYAIHHFTSTWRTEKALKDFARVRRHQRKWYRFFEWLRYVPNRIIRFILGDDFIDNMKKKLKK